MSAAFQVTANGRTVKNVTNYTISEDATPIDLADSSGSVGGLSLAYQTTDLPHVAKNLRRKTLTLADKKLGQWTGIIQSSSGSRTNANLTVNGRMTLLAVTRTAVPQTGTLAAAVTYYLGLCGVTDHFTYPTWFATTTVTLPGWRDQVWLRLKQLAAFYRFEIALVSDVIVFRDLRQNVAQTYRDSGLSWSAQDGQLAASVTVNWYKTTALANEAVYPPGRSFDGQDLLTFEANEKKVIQLALNASVASIVPPVATDVTYDNVGLSRSEYVISDATNHIVLPAMWYDYGGRLDVKIGYEDTDGTWINDTRTLTVTIQGPGLSGLSPFTIGLPTGDGNYEPAFTILGTGVDQEQHSITVETGLSPDLVQQDSGATIDSMCVQSEGDALTIASRALPALMGAVQQISVNTTGINRIGASGDVVGTTFGQYDALHPGLTFAGFDTANAGLATFEDFSEQQLALVSQDFPNQAFGNVAGARRWFDNAWYRIVSAQTSRGQSAYTAVIDTTFADFDAIWTGKTFADFDAAWAGATFGDLEMAPLAPTVPV